MLNINKIVNNSKVTLALEGRLDSQTANDLQNFENEFVGFNEIELDFAKLEYISSAGLRVLLYFKKLLKSDVAFYLINASKEIKEIFEITGFVDILDIR